MSLLGGRSRGFWRSLGGVIRGVDRFFAVLVGMSRFGLSIPYMTCTLPAKDTQVNAFPASVGRNHLTAILKPL
jgi:hypothetical protein